MFFARNTVEIHYFYWNIYKIMIFTNGDRIISILFKYCQIQQIYFDQAAVVQLSLPVYIYLICYFWNKLDGSIIIQEYRKIFLGSRWKESFWRFFPYFFGQINDMLVLLARHTVEIYHLILTSTKLWVSLSEVGNFQIFLNIFKSGTHISLQWLSSSYLCLSASI